VEEIILLVGEGCPGCEEVKKRVKNPSVKILDVTKSDEAAVLAAENNIFSIPTVILKSQKGVEKCDIELEGDKVKIKCKGKELFL